jgi:hypothetical protein
MYGKDTWELSLEDSDYDDGWKPPKKDNKPPAIQKAEWNEAFDFVKSFAHYGGAMLAVDVESWDRDQDVSCVKAELLSGHIADLLLSLLLPVYHRNRPRILFLAEG